MRRLRVLVSAAILLSGSPRADAQLVPAVIEVASNYFDPSRVSIESGDTVRWTARNAGHAVVADDGRFRFPESGTMAAGDSYAFTFTTDDEWVRFRCAVHSEMRGVVKVGEPPPSGGGDPIDVRGVPSAEYPTIVAALEGIEPGTAVDLSPGVYDASVLLTVDGVRIRGAGATPADVVLDGAGGRAAGVTVRAASVRIENLTVSGYTVAGIDIQDADFVGIDRVVVSAALPSGGRAPAGIRVRGARFGRIADVDVSAAERGIDVAACSPCDLLVDRVRLRDGVVGLRAADVTSLVLRGSTIERNASGVILAGDDVAALDGGMHLLANTIRHNVEPMVRRATDPFAAAPGVGIWIDGIDDVRVESNDIDTHRYGIAITGTRGPVRGVSVVTNHVTSSSAAAIAWDGIGAGACFAGNTGDGPGAPTSEPPSIDVLYPCDGTPRPGIPLPIVTVRTIGAIP